MSDMSTQAIPYVCSGCGRPYCKLWREYQTFLEHQRLLCGTCAGAAQGKDVSSLNADGLRQDEFGLTDQIGWMVPAVPTDDGTFWGYSSTPADAYEIWRKLPT